MYVCMYVCMYLHVCTYLYVCMYVYLPVCVYYIFDHGFSFYYSYSLTTFQAALQILLHKVPPKPDHSHRPPHAKVHNTLAIHLPYTSLQARSTSGTKSYTRRSSDILDHYNSTFDELNQYRRFSYDCPSTSKDHQTSYLDHQERHYDHRQVEYSHQQQDYHHHGTGQRKDQSMHEHLTSSKRTNQDIRNHYSEKSSRTLPSSNNYG